MSSFEVPGPDITVESVANDAPAIETSPWPRRIIEGAILILALVIGLTIRLAVLESAVVISRSMQPTFMVNSQVLMDHRASLHGQWQRGDIILFNVSDNWKNDEFDEDTLMKRIIGLPGETVKVFLDGTYINDKKIDEPYIKQEQQEHDPVEYTLGPDEYFVMGDNRNNSEDSRDHGPVKDQDIRGRVIFQIAPFDKIGRIYRPQYSTLSP